MKISELVQELNALFEVYGDVDVGATVDTEYDYDITGYVHRPENNKVWLKLRSK